MNECRFDQTPLSGCGETFAVIFLHIIVSDNVNDDIMHSCLGLERSQGTHYLPDRHASPTKRAEEEGESLGECLVNNNSNNNSTSFSSPSHGRVGFALCPELPGWAPATDPSPSPPPGLN